jgi:DNA/RNA endonuclease YhcR with UshA esterase domain
MLMRTTFAIGLLVAGTMQVEAHHSFAAAYDMSESISVTGRIVNVRLTNPHSFFFLDVENEAGETERWSFEAGTPSGMIRNGYSPQVIKTGDVVTITGFHARDPSVNAGMLRELVTADGTVYGMFGPRENASAR